MRSMAYNHLEPADAHLTNYTVEEEGNFRCQILTIIGMTTSGYDLVISKIDTCLIALLAGPQIKEIYHDDRAPERMDVEDILARIGFTVQVESEAMP